MISDIQLAMSQIAEYLVSFDDKEFEQILSDITDIYKQKANQKTTITIEISLNDIQSKAFQVVQRLTKSENYKIDQCIKTVFNDGLSLDSYIFLNAIEVARRFKEKNGTK